VLNSQNSKWRVGIDAGGTFTDVMAVDDFGEVQVLKVPSTPKDPVAGPISGIELLKSEIGSGAEVVDLAHGTTVGLNALLQRRFPPVALIVTSGFRHVLEIARHTVPGPWGSIYSWIKPERVVPLENPSGNLTISGTLIPSSYKNCLPRKCEIP